MHKFLFFNQLRSDQDSKSHLQVTPAKIGASTYRYIQERNQQYYTKMMMTEN